MPWIQFFSKFFYFCLFIFARTGGPMSRRFADCHVSIRFAVERWHGLLLVWLSKCRQTHRHTMNPTWLQSSANPSTNASTNATADSTISISFTTKPCDDKQTSGINEETEYCSPLRGQLGPAFLSREGASIVGWSGRPAAARQNRSVQNLPELIL